MEIYEKIQIEIEYINNEDVITTSSILDILFDHDNSYVDIEDILATADLFGDSDLFGSSDTSEEPVVYVKPDLFGDSDLLE